MSKPNVTRVQSATEWTASVNTLHISKPNVTRVQSATEWTASVHTLHISKPNVTRVQSATEWTASVHTLHMSKPNVTRVQSATEWTASVHTLHMSKPNVTRVQGATEWTHQACPSGPTQEAQARQKERHKREKKRGTSEMPTIRNHHSNHHLWRPENLSNLQPPIIGGSGTLRVLFFLVLQNTNFFKTDFYYRQRHSNHQPNHQPP